MIVLDELEGRYREIAFYKPRVAVRVSHTVPLSEGEVSQTETYYAHSDAEIRWWTEGDDREEKIARRRAALKADEARNEADKKRVGLIAADEAVESASHRLAEAEEAALKTMPVSAQGAAALAGFAMDLTAEERGADMPMVETLRNLGAMLARFSGEV
jgi:hypothetical protein